MLSRLFGLSTASAISITGGVGRGVLDSLEYWLNLVAFIHNAIRDWRRNGGLNNTASKQSLVTQIIFTGVTALPVVGLLALIAAAGLTLQVLLISQQLTNEIDIYQRLAHLVFYEISPLMTALVIITRSGSAITVDIGNMQLRNEINGLTLLGIDIDDYIVAPRILAGAICQTALAIYFSIIALYGGLLIAGWFFSSSFLFAMDDVFVALPVPVLLLFVVKNVLFGMIITGSACYHALQLDNTPNALPQQTQRAIVRSLAQVFIWSVLFTLILL